MSGFTVAAGSERLTLHPLRGEDAEAVARITDDPVIADSVSFLRRPFTTVDAEGLIARNGNGLDCFLAARRRADGDLVGIVGAHLVGSEAVEVGYWIGAAFHGRGYATEALKAVVAVLRDLLPDRAIFAECRPDNLPSWRVLAKVGFWDAGAEGERPGRRRLVLPAPHSLGSPDHRTTITGVPTLTRS